MCLGGTSGKQVRALHTTPGETDVKHNTPDVVDLQDGGEVVVNVGHGTGSTPGC